VILLSLALIVLSSYIIWRSTDGFELASDFLGRRLSQGIKGATINAVASSMPEFLSTFFFLFYLRDADGFSGGIGITGGSAVFNILVIPIAIYFILFFSKGITQIPIEQKTFRRDGIILFFLTAFVAFVVSSESLRWWHGALLTAPYLGYLLYLGFSHERITGKGNDFSYQPVSRRVGSKEVIMLDLEKIVLRGKMISTANAWGLLLASVAVMIGGTWLLVYATDELGRQLGIPILFVSVILASAASSIPDTMISIRDAKKGNYEDAFSNALGSNIFDISFALGFPLLVYTLLNGEIKMDQKIISSSADIWVVLFFITGITVFMLQKGCCLNKKKVIAMVILYLMFLVFIVFDFYHDIGFINLIREGISWF
jgi:cation:H+ antiporter